MYCNKFNQNLKTYKVPPCDKNQNTNSDCFCWWWHKGKILWKASECSGTGECRSSMGVLPLINVSNCWRLGENTPPRCEHTQTETQGLTWRMCSHTPALASEDCLLILPAPTIYSDIFLHWISVASQRKVDWKVILRGETLSSFVICLQVIQQYRRGLSAMMSSQHVTSDATFGLCHTSFVSQWADELMRYKHQEDKDKGHQCISRGTEEFCRRTWTRACPLFKICLILNQQKKICNKTREISECEKNWAKPLLYFFHSVQPDDLTGSKHPHTICSGY